MGSWQFNQCTVDGQQMWGCKHHNQQEIIIYGHHFWMIIVCQFCNSLKTFLEYICTWRLLVWCTFMRNGAGCQLFWNFLFIFHECNTMSEFVIHQVILSKCFSRPNEFKCDWLKQEPNSKRINPIRVRCSATNGPVCCLCLHLECPSSNYPHMMWLSKYMTGPMLSMAPGTGEITRSSASSLAFQTEVLAHFWMQVFKGLPGCPYWCNLFKSSFFYGHCDTESDLPYSCLFFCFNFVEISKSAHFWNNYQSNDNYFYPL